MKVTWGYFESNMKEIRKENRHLGGKKRRHLAEKKEKISGDSLIRVGKGGEEIENII